MSQHLALQQHSQCDTFLELFASSLCTLVQWESSETSYSNVLIPSFPCKIYNNYKFQSFFHGATFKSNDAQFVKYINTT